MVERIKFYLHMTSRTSVGENKAPGVYFIWPRICGRSVYMLPSRVSNSDMCNQRVRVEIVSRQK